MIYMKNLQQIEVISLKNILMNYIKKKLKKKKKTYPSIQKKLEK